MEDWDPRLHNSTRPCGLQGYNGAISFVGRAWSPSYTNPKVLWADYVKRALGPITKTTTPREKDELCIHNAVSGAINMTQPYVLNIAHASGWPKSPARWWRDVAGSWGFDRLMEMPYAIVGQAVAKDQTVQLFHHHLMVKPLSESITMACTDVGYHGKTAVAKMLATMLSCDYHYLDCKRYTNELQLLGPMLLFPGTSQASPLDKFFSGHEDKRCVVYLDNFEKANDEICTALIMLLHAGVYTERSGGRQSKPGMKTIWIMSVDVSGIRSPSSHMKTRSSEANFSKRHHSETWICRWLSSLTTCLGAISVVDLTQSSHSSHAPRMKQRYLPTTVSSSKSARAGSPSVLREGTHGC